MARKNLIYSYPFFNSQTVSTTTTSNSSKVDQLDYGSIALQWSASTLVAAATIEVKNGDNGDWRTLDFGSPITISSSSGSHEIDFLQMPFTDMRMKVTVTSGSGTVDAVFTAKNTGG